MISNEDYELLLSPYPKSKLVRDKMEFVGDWKRRVEFRNATDEEYPEFLIAKLHEEAEEVGFEMRRVMPVLLIQELADLKEVIRAIQDRYHITDDDIHTAQVKKFDERGGFYDRLILTEFEERK